MHGMNRHRRLTMPLGILTCIMITQSIVDQVRGEAGLCTNTSTCKDHLTRTLELGKVWCPLFTFDCWVERVETIEAGSLRTPNFHDRQQ